MGDFHFILRHALTGLVVLVFVLVGWWMRDHTMWEVVRKLTGGGTQNVEVASQIATLVVTAPLIGIAVQGVHILGLLVRRELFTDPARGLAAQLIREQFDFCCRNNPQDSKLRKCGDILKTAPDDALFVWLYHEHAPAHLIDWARRRRSYYYLGVNIALASLMGLLLGFLIPTLLRLERPEHVFVGLFATLCWIAGAIWLAQKMKQDVDGMELVWVLAHSDPNLWTSLRPPATRRFRDRLRQHTDSASNPA